MPGLGSTLFQLGVAEQAFPSDKTYIMPGFQISQGCEQTEMGISSLMASHIFKPRYRDEPFVKPAPRPKTFEPIMPSAPERKRTMSLPEIQASERRQAFSRRRIQTCGGRIEEEKEIAVEVHEALAKPTEEKPEAKPEEKPEERLLAPKTTPEQTTPQKQPLSKKKKRALKVMHGFGWLLLCPVYTMVVCLREAPDPDDEADFHEDVCLPCFT